MVFNVMPIMVAMSGLLTKGRDVADFTNSVMNNVVTLSSDSHQARMAQDIFRQEIRYARSLQIREDIRDQRKVMLECVTGFLYFGSMILGACFVTLIEGFPPLNTSRMVLLWWMLFGAWSVAFELLALWYALCFQVKLSQSARERLLRRYRYNLPHDRMVDRMGGKNLITSYHQLFSGISNFFSSPDADDPVPTEDMPERLLSVSVTSLIANQRLEVSSLRKGLNAWTHVSGEGSAKPTIIDAPYYLLNETLIRSPWIFHSETPLVFRVRGETTMYIAAQCPGNGGGVKESSMSIGGYQKALGSAVYEWPSEELPVVTAGFHPAWRGNSGHGEFQRVDGASIFIDAESLEIPVYKIVLASPRHGPDGYVDVVVCWQFRTNCEGLCMVLRKGAVHCNEDEWPMAEFNQEVCQIMPLNDYAGLFMKRGMVCLVINIWVAVLSKMWLIGDRTAWWLEPFMLCLILTPGLVVLQYMPISIQSTMETLSMTAVNRFQHVPKDVHEFAPSDIAERMEKDRLAAHNEPPRMPEPHTPPPAANKKTAAVSFSLQEPDARSPSPPPRPASPASATTGTATATNDSPPKIPRQSGGKVGSGADSSNSASGEGAVPASGLRAASLGNCCNVQPAPSNERETLQTGPAMSCLDTVTAAVENTCNPAAADGYNSEAVDRQRLYARNSVELPETGFDGKAGCSSGVASGIPSDANVSGMRGRLPSDGSSGSTGTKSGTPFGAFSNITSVASGREAASGSRTPWQSIAFQFSYFCSTLLSCAHVSPTHKIGDTPILRWLRNVTRALDCVFVLSVIIVMSSPAVEWFTAPAELGATPGYPGRRLEQETAAELIWNEVPVLWPPFLNPTAAIMDASRGLLHVASGSVLWTLGQTLNATAWNVLGAPAVLPEIIRGFGFAEDSLLALGDTAVYDVDPSLASGNWSSGKQQGLLDLASIASATGAGSLSRWTHSLGPVESAVIVDTPRLGVSSLAAIIASHDGDVQVCAPTSKAGGQMTVLARLDVAGQPLHNISGLHVSVASEKVLWASNHSGSILVLGLTTGRVFGNFRTLLRTEASTKQRLRGHSLLTRSSRIVALMGNSTHLFMLAEVERRLALFCTPYPQLSEDGIPGTEL